MITDARTTAARITALDLLLDAEGIGADPVALLLVAHAARDLGVDEVLVSVMVDDDQPEVARLRAYARVSVQVVSRLQEPVVHVADTRELQPAC